MTTDPHASASGGKPSANRGEASAASRWQLRTRTLEFGRLPAIMGILNVTPDSFSDGGRFDRVDAALRHAEQLVADGADILDVGGESTRPYSTAVAQAEEQARIQPVVREVCRRFSVPVSIDTQKASIAQVALDEGAEIINDVTGLEGDPLMIEVALRSGAGVCAMHMQGTPQTMQDHPHYDDVTAEILLYLRERRDALLQAGISRDKICLDPGIGFGKEHHHNIELIRQVGRFHELGQPLLVGHSRKGFVAHLLRDKERDRDPGTTGVALALAMAQVQVIRVHHVAMVKDAIQLFDAVRPICPSR